MAARLETLIRKLDFVDYRRAEAWPQFCHPTTGTISPVIEAGSPGWLGMSALGGGLNRWTQHFILDEKMEWRDESRM